MDADGESRAIAFRPVGRQRPALPYRPRPAGNAAYVRFGGPGVDGVEVFVSLRALRQMRAAAIDAWPDEAIGLLGGRACRDADGTFTVVETVEATRPGEALATPGSVHLSAAASAELRCRLAHRCPVMDTSGWFHSHVLSLAVFSREDRLEQSTWPDEHSVGIVAGLGGEGGTSFGVYTGPNAVRLTRNDDASPPTIQRAPVPVSVLQPHEDHRSTSRARRVLAVESRPLRIALVMLALAVLVLVAWRLFSGGRQDPQIPINNHGVLQSPNPAKDLAVGAVKGIPELTVAGNGGLSAQAASADGIILGLLFSAAVVGLIIRLSNTSSAKHQSREIGKKPAPAIPFRHVPRAPTKQPTKTPNPASATRPFRRGRTARNANALCWLCGAPKSKCKGH